MAEEDAKSGGLTARQWARLDDSMEWLFNPAKAPRCALHPSSWPQHPQYKLHICKAYAAHRCHDDASRCFDAHCHPQHPWLLERRERAVANGVLKKV